MPQADDADVVAALFDHVERTDAVIATPDATPPLDAASRPPVREPQSDRSGDTRPRKRPQSPVQVRGRTVADARAKAEKKFGTFRVVDGWRAPGVFGATVVLLVEPVPQRAAVGPVTEEDTTIDIAPAISGGDAPVSRAALHDDVDPASEEPGEGAVGSIAAAPEDSDTTAWNRTLLRSIGVPSVVMRRLPLDDPQTSQEWEALLLRIVSELLQQARPNASVTISATGPRGASALVEAAAAGLPVGTLRMGRTSEPATAERIVAAWCSVLPSRRASSATGPLLDSGHVHDSYDAIGDALNSVELAVAQLPKPGSALQAHAPAADPQSMEPGHAQPIAPAELPDGRLHDERPAPPKRTRTVTGRRTGRERTSTQQPSNGKRPAGQLPPGAPAESKDS